jgi:hypothetical protein
MPAIKVDFVFDKPTVVYYRKGNGKRKKLCTLTRGETARRASKYKVIVTRGRGAMLYDLKTGTAKSISKDDKIGSRFVP